MHKIILQNFFNIIIGLLKAFGPGFISDLKKTEGYLPVMEKIFAVNPKMLEDNIIFIPL